MSIIVKLPSQVNGRNPLINHTAQRPYSLTPALTNSPVALHWGLSLSNPIVKIVPDNRNIIPTIAMPVDDEIICTNADGATLLDTYSTKGLTRYIPPTMVWTAIIHCIDL